MDLITVENLCISLVDSGNTLVEVISFSIEKGDRLGLIGESGAGKSTILDILLGMEKPTRGTVKYHGQELNFRNRQQMTRFRSEVQVVFHDPKTSLNPRMRIGSIVVEPLRSLKIKENHTERVSEVLSAVGLDPDVVSRYPDEFSRE